MISHLRMHGREAPKEEPEKGNILDDKGEEGEEGEEGEVVLDEQE